jgi:hypothetical protein
MMFLVFVYTQFHRNAQMQQKITGLARTIALLEAERSAAAAPGDEAEKPVSPSDEG